MLINVTKFIQVTVFIICVINLPYSIAETQTLNLDQIKKDVTYLASDQLKGRGNFSKDIHKAASYIAKRFKDIGLINANDLTGQNLLQKYKVTNVSSKKLNVVINNQTISSENLAIVSTKADVDWRFLNNKKNNDFTLHIINKDDDFLIKLKAINQKGGEHLILLNPSHTTKFNRYKKYFSRGITHSTNALNKKNNGGTIVIAIYETSINKLNNVSVLASNTVVEYKLNNVIAILPGRTIPKEIVIFSSHYDHLGFEKHDENIIYNGADDNASGTAAVLNIAQHYAKQDNNARTLLFAAFSAEELGGLGSINFSKQLKAKNITAMFNIEMIGKSSSFGAGNLWMTGIEHSNLGELMNQTLAKTGEEIHKDPFPKYDLFYRSDNATLARLGVPAHSFSSAKLNKDEHYHQVTDDISTINFPSMFKVINKLIKASEPIVNGTVTPSRIDVKTIKYKGKIY